LAHDVTTNILLTVCADVDCQSALSADIVGTCGLALS